MKRLALACVLAGCTATVTALDVAVDGTFPVDQMRLYAALTYGPLAQVSPALATPLTLPYSFPAYLPNRDDTAQIAVEAMRDGAVVGSALSAPFAVTSHATTPVSLALHARCGSDPCDGTELFCDGFEGGLGAWSSAMGMPKVDTGVACDGTSSLAPATATYVTKSGLTLPTTTYIRMHVEVSGGTSTPAITFLALGDASSALTLGYDAAQGGFVTTYGGKTALFAGGLILNQWLCVKMEARLDSDNGLIAVSVDDNEYGRFDRLALATPGQLTSLDVGLLAAASTVGFHVDDVAIGASPLPCD